MTRSNHALVPRRTRRPGAHGAHAAVVGRSGHPVVRRSSFALAAALTSVALTTTAAVSVTTTSGGAADSSSTASAAELTAPPVVTDPEVRSASAKADAVLEDAAYVTREGDLSVKERKRVRAAAQDLRAMVNEARDTTVAAVGGRQAAASRDGDRVSLAERAAGESAAPDAAATEDADRAPSADATAPTNLASATTGALALDEQGTTELPVLGTPLVGSVGSVDPAPGAEDAEPQAAEAPVAATAPSADRIEKVTVSLQRIITTVDGDVVVSVKPGPTPEEIAAAKKAAEERRAARAARAAEREAAETKKKAAARAAEAKAMAEAAKSYGNGEIPSNVLCGLSWAPEQQLRCDAAAALEKLNGAFRGAFGRNLDVVDGYRSYAEQVSVAATRGSLAAVPGTSNHGLGQAVDLSGGVESFGSAEHSWMAAHAGKYGWKLPGWAQAGGSKPEAWHWEYGTSY